MKKFTMASVIAGGSLLAAALFTPGINAQTPEEAGTSTEATVETGANVQGLLDLFADIYVGLTTGGTDEVDAGAEVDAEADGSVLMPETPEVYQIINLDVIYRMLGVLFGGVDFSNPPMTETPTTEPVVQ